MSNDKPDYGYAMQPVKRLAQCPFCARLVELVEGSATVTCQHYRRAVRIEGQDYVEFFECG